MKGVRTFTRKPRPESGLDCLICAEFAWQRHRSREEEGNPDSTKRRRQAAHTTWCLMHTSKYLCVKILNNHGRRCTTWSTALRLNLSFEGIASYFSERDQIAFFQVLGLDWRSPECGDLWYKSRHLKRTICSLVEDRTHHVVSGGKVELLVRGDRLPLLREPPVAPASRFGGQNLTQARYLVLSGVRALGLMPIQAYPGTDATLISPLSSQLGTHKPVKARF